MNPATRWLPEEDEMLRQLIAVEKRSFSQAAMALASKFRNSKVLFTRNSCISRSYRLGLEGRTPFPDKRNSPHVARPKPSKPKFVPKSDDNPSPRRRPSTPRSFELVDGTCQFIADPADGKCGKPHDGRTNWCEYHRQLCYEPDVSKPKNPFRPARSPFTR